jgi:uncharacterized protein YeaC (DUF1315 family)
MKMSPEHYAKLKERVTLLLPKIPEHVEHLRKDPKVKVLRMRLLWDLFHATHMHTLYTYEEFDYTDAHIETAMNAIMRELNVEVS